MMLTHATIVVKDQNAALEFYTRRLALRRKLSIRILASLAGSQLPRKCRTLRWFCGKRTWDRIRIYPLVTNSQVSARAGFLKSMTAGAAVIPDCPVSARFR